MIIFICGFGLISDIYKQEKEKLFMSEIFLAVITFSKPALFSGDFSYKNGKTEVMIWIPKIHFSEMHD